MKPDTKCVPSELRAFFEEHPRIALAFSGGVDSAYLLYAALACGVQPGVYYVHSQFQPKFELDDACALADELNCTIKRIEMDILADACVRSNPPDRCYHCKMRIFSAICSAARADGYDEVMDGTNASDDASDRPGMRALARLRVLSPLRECGISKAQVRILSREAGLFTWNKSAYACLATRVPAGTEIDEAALQSVERAEEKLARMGFTGMRVRLNDRGVRLELPEAQLPMVLEKRGEIIAALEADFREITLDLRPRREKET